MKNYKLVHQQVFSMSLESKQLKEKNKYLVAKQHFIDN